MDLFREENLNIMVHDTSDPPTTSRSIVNPVVTFDEAFYQYPEILAEIAKQGFEKPSPIQSQMWPLALKGYDVIGIAQVSNDMI